METAENIGAAYVAVPDLYLLWLLVAKGRLSPSSARRQLIEEGSISQI